jgi:hypothetical protein
MPRLQRQHGQTTLIGFCWKWEDLILHVNKRHLTSFRFTGGVSGHLCFVHMHKVKGIMCENKYTKFQIEIIRAYICFCVSACSTKWQCKYQFMVFSLQFLQVQAQFAQVCGCASFLPTQPVSFSASTSNWSSVPTTSSSNSEEDEPLPSDGSCATKISFQHG